MIITEKEKELNDRAWNILRLVVGEWETDPVSVQCFDLRIVKEAKRIVKEIEQIKLKEVLGEK